MYQKKKPKLSAGATQGFTPYNGFNVTSYQQQYAAPAMQYRVAQELPVQVQSQVTPNALYAQPPYRPRPQSIRTESPPPLESDRESWAAGNEPSARASIDPPSVVGPPVEDPASAPGPAPVPVPAPASLEEGPIESVVVPPLQEPTDLHRALDDENIVIHTVEDDNV